MSDHQDHGQKTVRQLLASVQEWAADVDEMIMIIGHDRWLDIPVREFQRMGESEDPVAEVMAWHAFALTRSQIASLLVYDDETRTT